MARYAMEFPTAEIADIAGDIRWSSLPSAGQRNALFLFASMESPGGAHELPRTD